MGTTVKVPNPEDYAEGMPPSGPIGTVGGVLASQSRNALGRIKNLTTWLKANPGASAEDRQAAQDMLREAQSHHAQAKEARKQFSGR
jgi:hypothetical protein